VRELSVIVKTTQQRGVRPASTPEKADILRFQSLDLLRRPNLHVFAHVLLTDELITCIL
jgi:hypothetical protein